MHKIVRLVGLAGRLGPMGRARVGPGGPRTPSFPWYGERLDLDYAIHACFATIAHSRRPPLSVPNLAVSDG
jgi:hypothetical protein